MTLDSAIESLLENAALTSDLDDAAADALLDWGTACLRLIYRTEAAQQPDKLAERMRAVRRLMRATNKWAPRCALNDVSANLAALESIVQEAGPIYLENDLPSRAALVVFLQGHHRDPVPDLIANLRKLLE